MKRPRFRNPFIMFATSIDDKNGKPHGFIWVTVITFYGNFRIFPIGWYKQGEQNGQ